MRCPRAQRQAGGLVLLGLLLALGCRGGFDGEARDAGDRADAPDAIPDPVLAIEESASEVVVDVPGRFAVTFRGSRNWQPSRWTDASRGEVDLSASPNGDLGNLFNPVLLCSADECVSAAAMTSVSFEVTERNDRSVTIVSGWQWMLGAVPIDGHVAYTIDVDGTWSVEASVTNKDSATLSASAEFADSHVSETLPWRVTDSLDGTYFDFHLPATTDLPALAFEVSLDSSLSAVIASDEPNNCYFVTSINLPPQATEAFRFMVRLWRAP